MSLVSQEGHGAQDGWSTVMERRVAGLRGDVGTRAYRAFLHTRSVSFALQIGWEVRGEF